MTRTLRSVAIAALAVTSACGDNLEPKPDGEYRVTVEQTQNTCNTDAVGSQAPGITTRLDLFRRSDGLYDLHWLDGWVPPAFAFSAVDLGDGSVRHGVGTATEVVGVVEAEALDLELVYRGAHGAGQPPCERHLAVRGVKRPMFAADSVDGRYIVTIRPTGDTCAGGSAIASGPARNLRMEVLPFRDDRTSVVVEGLGGSMLRFWIEPIGSGGAIHLTHDVLFAADGDHITELDGTIDGTIDPDHVELVAAVVAKSDPAACVRSYDISGRRWRPSDSSMDAEYRTRYRMTDSCDPTFETVYEDVGFAVAQPGDQLDLIDHAIQSTVSLDGSTVAAVQGSDGSPVYRGQVTPRRASYVVEDHYFSLGRECVVALEVEGTARYLPIRSRAER